MSHSTHHRDDFYSPDDQTNSVKALSSTEVVWVVITLSQTFVALVQNPDTHYQCKNGRTIIQSNGFIKKSEKFVLASARCIS